MKLTVAEILHYPEFSGFKLMAGAGGISNQVTSCGILDYEYDPRLKNKYVKLSFIPNQMILTSLQYAKDDPGCLTDTIRLLKNRKCSCLIIKNVYGLTISPHALHFADSVNFPIILIKNSEQYFEKIIINVYKRLECLYNFDKYETIISQILALPERDPQQKELQTEINPCLQPDILCLYFLCNTPLKTDDYIEMEKAATNDGLLTAYNSLLRYKNGLLYIHSSYNFKNAKAHELADKILCGNLRQLSRQYKIGVSSIHYRERKIKLCIKEAIYSSYFHLNADAPYQLYEALGINSILLPYCHEPAMQRFSASILDSLRDYDSENKTALLKTALSFVQNGGNIAQTAASLHQHKNTIRYRLNQINSILRCNILTPEGYELLSIAVKIDYCSHIDLTLS